MGPLSRWAVNHPKTAILTWIGFAAAIVIAAANFGGQFNNSFSLPDTESAKAQELLEQLPNSEGFTAATAKIVWSPDQGKATDDDVTKTISATLKETAEVPGVACVIGPYGPPQGKSCPDPKKQQELATSVQQSVQESLKKQQAEITKEIQKVAETNPNKAKELESRAESQAQAVEALQNPSAEQQKVLAGIGAAGISKNGTVGYATVIFSGDQTSVNASDASAVLTAAQDANNTPGLTVGANGSALEYANQAPPSSEGIGILVALFILLLAFGSLIGAILPVLSAVISLAVGQQVVLLTANVFNVAEFAPQLAAMIGLAVGIDYALFVINRHKQAIDSGSEPRDAATEAVRTAGRAVVFAAITVVIALLGLFVLGIEFFYGLSIAAAATVLIMMIGATILLPAVLSLLGHKAFAIKMPWARKPKTYDPERGPFARYGGWLEKKYKVMGALGLLVLIVIAIPLFSLRLGFPDDSGKPEGSSARTAYDLISEGFGPGLNGPFIVALETETAGDNVTAIEFAGIISENSGVAAAIPGPMTPDQTVAAIQVIPASEPQNPATTQLLDSLRLFVIPDAENLLPAKAYVGGTQAITSDFTTVLTDALPLFLTVVIGLGFVALVILFRSLLVPLTGAVTSLLSLGAAMGVTVAVFQWGWLADVLGITGTGPIIPFLPIMVFAILFGLSMDYQVFLVSRMQEEWALTGDNRKSIRRGLASSGRVVAIAAAIMFSVFGAFVLSDDSTIKLFGLALATAVLFDAFIVRLIIVPSLMFSFGKANWWLPTWLGRILPEIKVEAEEVPTSSEADETELEPSSPTS